MPSRYLFVASLVSLTACAVSAEDGPDDSFSDTADAVVVDATPQAYAVLRLVNHESYAQLNGYVASNAAKGIVAYRNGADGVAGTADDRTFATLAQLDAVKYVGPATLDSLAAHATTYLDAWVAITNHGRFTFDVNDVECHSPDFDIRGNQCQAPVLVHLPMDLRITQNTTVDSPQTNPCTLSAPISPTTGAFTLQCHQSGIYNNRKTWSQDVVISGAVVDGIELSKYSYDARSGNQAYGWFHTQKSLVTTPTHIPASSITEQL